MPGYTAEAISIQVYHADGPNRSLVLPKRDDVRLIPNPQRFIDALDALCHGGPTKLRVNPDRPGRDEPRVIKRAKDHYTYMTKPRDELRQALGITRVAA